MTNYKDCRSFLSGGYSSLASRYHSFLHYPLLFVCDIRRETSTAQLYDTFYQTTIKHILIVRTYFGRPSEYIITLLLCPSLHHGESPTSLLLCKPPIRSVQVASKDAILTGYVNKSRDDRVVCMCVQLKR